MYSLNGVHPHSVTANTSSPTHLAVDRPGSWFRFASGGLDGILRLRPGSTRGTRSRVSNLDLPRCRHNPRLECDRHFRCDRMNRKHPPILFELIQASRTAVFTNGALLVRLRGLGRRYAAEAAD